MTSPHVVVVGVGFAGVAASRALAKAGCRVTIIDQHAYTTFQPLLYQVATGGLNPGDVTYSLRSLVARLRRRVRFRRALVTGIDQENRRVQVDDGPDIDYDYLVLSQGATANFFGIPGAARYAKSLYTRADALSVRDTIFGAMERLAAQPSAAERGLTTLVVGGGATGVEMAGTLAEMRDVGIPAAYPEIDPKNVRVVLVEMGPNLLAPFAPRLRDYARQQLVDRGVDVRTDTAIAEVFADHVELKGGETMQADLVIWAAGIGGYPDVKSWDVSLGKGGRIVVDDFLRVKGKERIFAAGDAAISENHPLPQLAQPAIQMGKHVAHQVHRLEQGEPLEEFHYIDKGTMATIGRSAAVVQLKQGLKFTGLPAWLLWVGVHLFSLLGGRNRIQAMVSLAARYIAWPREGAATIVGDLKDTPGRQQLLGAEPADPVSKSKDTVTAEREQSTGQPKDGSPS